MIGRQLAMLVMRRQRAYSQISR